MTNTDDLIVPRDTVRELLAPTAAAGLPVPRLQLVYVDRGREEYGTGAWYVEACYYLMVFATGRWDCRNLNQTEDGYLEPGYTAVVAGITTCKSGRRQTTLDTPFRDGVHARWDSKTLGGWSVYVSRGSEYRKVEDE